MLTVWDIFGLQRFDGFVCNGLLIDQIWDNLKLESDFFLSSTPAPESWGRKVSVETSQMSTYIWAAYLKVYHKMCEDPVLCEIVKL